MVRFRFSRLALGYRVFFVAAALAVGVFAQAQTSLKNKAALPLVFEENAGQLAPGVAFAGRARGYALEVRPDELRFDLPGAKAGQKVSLTFAGTRGGVPQGIAEAGFRTNYYEGSDPKSWRTGVRNFERVGLKGVYPGVDAAFYAQGQEIEHDFVVAAGADASLVKMRGCGGRGRGGCDGGCNAEGRWSGGISAAEATGGVPGDGGWVTQGGGCAVCLEARRAGVCAGGV